MIYDRTENPIDGEPTKEPGTAEDNSGVGTVEWKNPANALLVDSEAATAAVGESQVSHYLKLTNFGLPVPAGADVHGIGLTTWCQMTNPGGVNGGIEDNRVRLIVGGVVKSAEDKATPGRWSGVGTERVYGGPEDLWGLSLSQADVTDAGFGIAISVKAPSGAHGATAKIFGALMLATYSEGANENRVCFASRSVEFADNGVRRQHVTDEVWGDLFPEGLLLNAPVGGQAGRDARLLVIPSVGDFDTRADSATVDPRVKVYYRPAYLFAREASE